MDIDDTDDLIERNIIDSLGLLELIAYIENEFHITIQDEAIVSGYIQSLSGAISYILSNKKATDISSMDNE
jgi:acyl carrier protein